jgi:hypothetical protein
MKARYPGTCPWCAGPVEPGQDIICAGGRWGHQGCRPQAQRRTQVMGRTGAHRPEHDEDFAWPPWEEGPELAT